MKDRVIIAALVVSGFALTLGLAHWHDGGSQLNGAADGTNLGAKAASAESTRLAARDGVWSANPFSAHNVGADVQSLTATPPQKLPPPPDESKVGLPATPDPQAAETPANNSAAELTNDVEAPAYESQVDRDEELGHASRNR